MTREQAIRYVEAAENEEEYARRKGKVYAIIHGERFAQPLSEWYANFMQRWKAAGAGWQCACGRTIAKGEREEHQEARRAGQCVVCYGKNLCQKCGIRLIANGKSKASAYARRHGLCHKCYTRGNDE